MIIVDRALAQREKENQPINVGLNGAGFMGRGFAPQLSTAARDMRLAADDVKVPDGCLIDRLESGQCGLFHP